MKKTLTILVFIIIAMSLIACKENSTEPKKEIKKVPTLTTTEITNIDKTTSTAGGNITSDGGATITARGVCWSTSQNPTISGSKTIDGTGTGSFTSSITGLTANTTYYVRAYATNSEGTSYGNEVSFNTLNGFLGAYIGQKTPGMIATRFNPDKNYTAVYNVWKHHGRLAVSPDGTEIMFTKYLDNNDNTEIWVTKIQNGYWTTPEKASFNKSTRQTDPYYLHKDTLLLITNYQSGFIQKVIRTANGWSDPIKLNVPIPTNYETGWGFTIAKNRTLYFELYEKKANSTGDLFSSKLVNGQYQTPIILNSEVNTNFYEFGSFVDPDEKFIIYSSNRTSSLGASDMYISRKKDDGSWSVGINLGSTINTANDDASPYITPDGKYFFFTTQKAGDQGYMHYWIDIKYLDSIK